LLKEILPETFADRVINGEKNLSFSVQSASIVFFEIVHFSSWIVSLPIEETTKILNFIFQKFDENVRKYSLMTKIKIVGGCYEAAGCLFADVHVPASHAKEALICPLLRWDYSIGESRIQPETCNKS
jgi:hypothetical protein